jgi:hypothetical protein
MYVTYIVYMYMYMLVLPDLGVLLVALDAELADGVPPYAPVVTLHGQVRPRSPWTLTCMYMLVCIC